MQAHVFDTFAKCKNGRIMHFDVITLKKDELQAQQFARLWLIQIGEPDAEIKPGACAFCHTTTAIDPFIEAIKQDGFAIYKLEGCPK